VIPIVGTRGIPGAIRASIAHFTIRFWVSGKVVSTPTENIVLNGYFSKITDLIGI
jgi:hypothetical protein